MRQAENARVGGTSLITVPEGRMRLHEYQHSVIVESNKKFSVDVTEKAFKHEVGKNPFESEYDESMNPFAEEDLDDTNPFKDDYDKNLNPFS